MHSLWPVLFGQMLLSGLFPPWTFQIPLISERTGISKKYDVFGHYKTASVDPSLVVVLNKDYDDSIISKHLYICLDQNFEFDCSIFIFFTWSRDVGLLPL